MRIDIEQENLFGMTDQEAEILRLAAPARFNWNHPIQVYRPLEETLDSRCDAAPSDPLPFGSGREPEARSPDAPNSSR